jgi:YHS domain-containing protein
MNFMQRFVLAFMFFALINATYAQVSQIFKTEQGAIRGYDPVAFFKESKPVAGLKEHSIEWNGASWYFSSKENKELFEANPEQYAPQYGGYCAYGTADGHKAPTQTDTWTIVNNKLYFNYNKKVRTEWLKKQTEYIKQADLNWPTVKDSN